MVADSCNFLDIIFLHEGFLCVWSVFVSVQSLLSPAWLFTYHFADCDNLMKEFQSLPVTADTVRVLERKSKLESKLREVDDAIKIFSRPKVFVKMDAWASLYSMCLCVSIIVPFRNCSVAFLLITFPFGSFYDAVTLQHFVTFMEIAYLWMLYILCTAHLYLVFNELSLYISNILDELN